MYKPSAVSESSLIHVEQIYHGVLLNQQRALSTDNIKDVWQISWSNADSIMMIVLVSVTFLKSCTEVFPE